jgi:hypothetical protein
MYKDILKFGDKRTGCSIMTVHNLILPSSQENFLPKTTSPSFTTCLRTFCFPDGRYHHLDTLEAIMTESHVLLHSLSEHGFQHAFKNGRISGNGAYDGRGLLQR